LKTKSTAIILIAILLFSGKSQAQFYSDMSIGLNGGIYIYQGDISPWRSGALKTIKPGLSLFVKKPINHFLAARLHITIANLKGDESLYGKPAYMRQRNFSFNTSVKEISAQLVWNVLGRNYEDRGIMPYIFSGAGVSLIGVKKDYSRINTSVFTETSSVMTGLAADNARGTPSTIFSVPAGFGLEYSISSRISVNMETSYRFVFTDYLDGFSQSANPKLKDHYYSVGGGLIYKFAAREAGISCPAMKY
jgi:hypothetical protein